MNSFLLMIFSSCISVYERSDTDQVILIY